MKCYKHNHCDAVGICVRCGRGLCSQCAEEFSRSLLCKQCVPLSKDKCAKIKNSFLVPFIKCVINIVCKFSPYQIISRLIWSHNEVIPFCFAEGYVLIRLLIVSLCFILLDCHTGLASCLLSILCILMLIDILAATVKIIFIERVVREDHNGNYILVRDVSRWIILVLLNILEIVLYFGVLYFKIGDRFCMPITDRLTAIYQSLLTFTTLGYGEIHPDNPLAKILVIFQLVYFIIFVFLLAPRAFSAIRVKQHTNEKLGKIKNR